MMDADYGDWREPRPVAADARLKLLPQPRAVVYLAGPIAGCDDEEAMGWRAKAADYLNRHEIAVLDPMVRDFRGGPIGTALATVVVEGDKADIRKADAILAYCPRPTVGTSMEILYAHLIGVPVVAVIPEGTSVSPWITYHATRVARTFDDGLALVEELA